MSEPTISATRWPFGPHLAPAMRGDCHPAMPRGTEYHRGDRGGGAASVEEGVFLFGLVCGIRPALCLETGTETGWTAAWIGRALALLDSGGLLTTLEHDQSRIAPAREWLEAQGLTPWVDVVAADSIGYLTHMPALGIDFALLDSAIELRAEETRLLMPRLSARAVVAVHDTAKGHPMAHGRDLDAAFRDMRLDVLHLPTPRGMTLLRVRP